MDIPTILTRLKYNDGTFPREALNEAINNQELIIPELLKIIEFTKNNIEELITEEKYFVHIYAMYLLAQFKEKHAYRLIIDFFSMPGDMAKDITGDVVTEALGRILASVYDGNISLLKSLIENKELDEYVRSAALECLLVLVAVGTKSREEIIDYFKELFNGKLEGDCSYIWTALVSRSTRLYPEEVYDEIKLAYEEELIECFFVDLQTVEKTIKEGKEKTLRSLRNNSRYKLIENIISEMQNWACFYKSRNEEKKRKKIGRNAPCPCGSGKKYKKCCLNSNSRS